jgi:DNA-binding MarR family transcriptional regulator
VTESRPPVAQGTDHVDDLRAQWRRELPDLDTEPMAILGRIHRVASLVRPAIESVLGSHGLDRGEFDILASLRRAGPPYRLSPTELYGLLMVPSGSLTHRLGRLEAAGLVSRESSLSDGRSHLVRLTREGRSCVERAFRADMEAEKRLIASLSERHRSELADLLRKLAVALESTGLGRIR